MYLFNHLTDFFVLFCFVCSLCCIIISPAFVRCARRNGTTKQTKSFEESSDNIWLLPAASHSLLCRRGTEGIRTQLSGLKTFHSSKTEGFYPVHSRENCTCPSSLSLISVLLYKLKANTAPQSRTMLRRHADWAERRRLLIVYFYFANFCSCNVG